MIQPHSMMSHAPNPFVYDHPVQPEDLIDREAEVAKLLELARGSHNTRLAAPRRYGKTSLLHRVTRDAEATSLATVYVDFSGVVSLDEVTSRIEEAYSRSVHTALQRALAWARSLVEGVKLGTDEASVAVEFRDPARAQLLYRLLDLPRRSFERSGTATLVVFDEFQAVLAASDNADGVIRSKIQHHGKAASYVFAGSHPGLMAELFGSRERPLYGQARPIELGRLADSQIADYIADRFERTDRQPGELLDALIGLVHGHPQRAMLVAHHLWEATPSGSTADAELWPEVLTAVFGELEEAFEATWQGLTANQRRLMALLASGERAIFSERVLGRFRLARGSVAGIRDALIAQGDLEKRGDELVLIDPLFETWIANGRRPPRDW